MAVETDLDQSLIAVLKQRRAAAGITQARLAMLVNDSGFGLSWTRTHVAALEAGRRRTLRIIEMIALCAVHDVSLADLLVEAKASPKQIATLLGHSVDGAELHTELVMLRHQVRAIHSVLSSGSHTET